MRKKLKQSAGASADCSNVSVNTQTGGFTDTEMLAQPRSSNTGLNSQNDWSVGIDWLDITLRGVSSGRELCELVSDFELILGSVIDFSPTRRVFNGKYWAGSGRSESGALLWYNPPREASDRAAVGPDGNLYSHPGLLPAGCYCVTPEDALTISSQLPEYVRLIHVDDHPPYVEPITGYAYPHHGYKIVPSDIPAEPQVGELKVAMGARVLERVTTVALFEYLAAISSAYVLDCSRIDIALDDNNKAIPISEVVRASIDGNFFDCKYTKRIESGNRGEQVGVTVYFGSPASDRKLRVYDKTVESRGVTDCNRWEVEFHREKAGIVLGKWMEWMKSGEQSAAQGMTDIVVSAVDFRDRSAGDPNRARCKRLGWYSRMVSLLQQQSVAIRCAKKIQTMQKSVDWLRRSVAATLACCKKVMKKDFGRFIDEVVEIGCERMPISRRKMVDLTDLSVLCY